MSNSDPDLKYKSFGQSDPPESPQMSDIHSVVVRKWADEIWSQIHSSGCQCQVLKNRCCSVQKLVLRQSPLNHRFCT